MPAANWAMAAGRSRELDLSGTEGLPAAGPGWFRFSIVLARRHPASSGQVESVVP